MSRRCSSYTVEMAEALLSLPMPATSSQIADASNTPPDRVSSSLRTLEANGGVKLRLTRPGSRRPATWIAVSINHEKLAALVARHTISTSAVAVHRTAKVPTIISPARIREAALGAYFKGCLGQIKVIAAAGGDAQTIQRYCDETVANAPLED